MKIFAMIAILAGQFAFAGTTTETTTATTPLSVCKNLVELTLKKDFAGVQNLSTAFGPHHGKSKGAHFDKMHKENWSKLEKLSCTTETVANDHAFVEAQSEAGARLIPFVKTEAGWKFDMKTYMSFYHFGADHAQKGKK